MANINKIKLSGQTYNIEDSNAPKTVELTQAQYDALSVKDPNTFYIITDATSGDLSNYYTKSETSGATEISTALGNKQDTLVSGTNIKTINNESILGSGNIEIEGGGKAINAGRGIKITTGETADTVSFDLPIWNPSGAYKNIAIGSDTNHPNGMSSVAVGQANTTNVRCSFVSGVYNILKNENEAGFGYYNNSVSGSSTLGDGGNTLFSVGNGTSSARHNAFEIRQNGDIYITKDGADVKLQDQLGGGGSSYTAGDGIDITNDVISVTGKVDTTAFTAHTADTVIHVTSAEKAAWNAKSDFSGSYNDLTNKPTIPTVPTSNTAFTNDAGYITIDAISGKVDTSTYDAYTAATDTTLASKQTTLTAGTGISIVDNVISATGGGGGMTEDDELLLSTALTDLNDRKIDASEVKANYQKKGDYVTTSTLNTRLAEYETALDEQNVEEVTAYALNDLNDRFGGLKLTKITESEYAALTTKDENTLYIVVADPS